MRLVTIVEDGRPVAAVVRDDHVLPLATPDAGRASVRRLAAGGADGLGRVAEWADRQPDDAYRALGDVALGPVVADPGAIYTIGLNYAPVDGSDEDGSERPMVFGKIPTSVTGHGAIVTWDRSLTANVDAECELGVVIGERADAVSPEDAMGHVFGYTIVNDMGSRDPWLDGDQWLLGKSMAGFCPVGPWLVTPDELDPSDLRLACAINGTAIQDGRTSQMRFGIAEVISYLSRHVALEPGDLIATGTPARLAGLLGPDRHLEPGDIVTCWIEGIGELTTTIA